MKRNDLVYCSYSKSYQDVASIYIKDCEVIKHKGEYEQEYSDEEILKAIRAEEKVIVEIKGKLICFFKDEDKRLVTEITNHLLNMGYEKIKYKVWYGLGKAIKDDFLMNL